MPATSSALPPGAVNAPATTAAAAGGDDDDDHMSAGEPGGGEEEDDGDLDADQAQIKELRNQGKMLETLADLGGAEWAYQEALRIDPLNVRTLTVFAVFLHRKRGEMDRAEAFFGRALQQCLPALFNAIASSSKRKVRPADSDEAAAAASAAPGKAPITLGTSEPASTPAQDVEPGSSGSRIKNRDVVVLLLKFASFLSRAQGDVEAATAVYKKAVEIEPKDPIILGSAAHFLASEGGDREEALALYSRALKADPSNALHALWYAKLLRKVGNIAQAEVMYKVAIQKASEKAAQQAAGTNPNLPSKPSPATTIEASAICNYATFVYKQRKDPDRALNLFEAGMRRFPTHKGLLKNYQHFLKAEPSALPDPALVEVLKNKKQSTANMV